MLEINHPAIVLAPDVQENLAAGDEEIQRSRQARTQSQCLSAVSSALQQWAQQNQSEVWQIGNVPDPFSYGLYTNQERPVESAPMAVSGRGARS